ncbi:hypothetical protein PCI56_01110 [Plesiomonas shigelloides subsp. oncorhynchi]|nr:hypothetical protein [Plesiomonas shigelloides]
MSRKIETVESIINGANCPLPLDVIPNHMGINLCNVESIEWVEQDDGQLVELKINFIPSGNDQPA